MYSDEPFLKNAILLGIKYGLFEYMNSHNK